MKHVQQPARSSLCGQACVAIVLGRTLTEAALIMNRRGQTRTRDLIEALGEMAVDKRLIPLRQRAMPQFCILKVCQRGTNRSHWVVRSGLTVYDPADPCPWNLLLWLSSIGGNGWRVTSALELARARWLEIQKKTKDA